MNRLLDFLSICYRYNSHDINRVYISVIGDKSAIIIYKHLIKNQYKIRGFETNLDSSKVMEQIKEFYKHIPYNPEVCALCFKDFTDFLGSYYYETRDLAHII